MLYYSKKLVRSETSRMFRYYSHTGDDTTYMDNSIPHKQHPVSYCIEAIRYWFNVNTLPPLWLYKGLRHRFIGYVVAVCLQVAMVVVVAESIKIDSTFRFSGLLAMLMVVVLALNWGPAPGL